MDHLKKLNCKHWKKFPTEIQTNKKEQNNYLIMFLQCIYTMHIAFFSETSH